VCVCVSLSYCVGSIQQLIDSGGRGVVDKARER